MSKSGSNPWLKYAINFGVCLLFAIVYFFVKIPLSQLSSASMVDITRVLSDAFMVPGTLSLMFGLLLWLSSEGALDGLGYLGSFTMKTLIPGKRKTIERYGEYVERKRASRKGGFGFLCITGGFFLLLSVAFLGLFYVYY